MDNDNNTDYPEQTEGQEEEYAGAGASASRARNRTVMLTPEITGEVRARLAKDLGTEPDPAPAPAGGGFERVAPATPSGGFVTPQQDSGGFTRPVPQQPTQSQPMGASAHAAAFSGEGVVWSKQSPVVGFLVSYDADESGSIFELRSGRLIVTSEAPGAGNFMVVNNETVSPMHAIMRISGSGEIQVLDQLSEYGTKVIRFGSGDEEELSGDKAVIEHGDVIWFGERSFHVCLVAGRGE